MEYPILPLLSSPGGFGCAGEGSGGSGSPLSHIPALYATAILCVLLPWALVRAAQSVSKAHPLSWEVFGHWQNEPVIFSPAPWLCSSD